MNYHSNSGSFKLGQQTKQIAGMKFGRLHVHSDAGRDKHGNAMWNCVCDCGNTGVFKGRNLTIGKTKSCGCWLLEQQRSPKKHGHTSRKNGASSEWMAWKAIRQRCRNPNHREWKDYGGRGITVCERWNVFLNFLQDMGVKPSPDLSIERIDNNAGYCKENCIWATRRVQNRNTRRNIILTFNGKSQTLKDWATEFGINHNTLGFRILRGWPMEKALAQPKPSKRWPK